MTVNGISDIGSKIRTLSTTSTEHLHTPFFQVTDFGFLRLTSAEQYAETWYPTEKDIVPAGWLGLDIHNATLGDFDGNGLGDLVLQPMLFPHIVPRETQITPIFLLQDLSGTFLDSQSISYELSFPNRRFLYRLAVEDFNNDGIADVAISTMGSTNRVAGEEKTAFEAPVVIFGSKSKFLWTDSYSNFNLQEITKGLVGYTYGHSMASGDFNGDGFTDWFSNWHEFKNNKQGQFISSVLLPNGSAKIELAGSQTTSPYGSQWWWPLVNSAASADFDEDGYDDLVYSTMPNLDPMINGGDLVLVKGSSSGLLGGTKVIPVFRDNSIQGNVGTNFIVAPDINGDGHADILFMEHLWTTDAGDSTSYYAKGKLRVFLGDGKGNLTENRLGIVDPYASHRHGEGNIHVIDVNGDGWRDIVLTGYQVNLRDVWSSGGDEFDYTTIFLNDKGTLRYVEPKYLAYVEPHQFSGDESLRSSNRQGVSKLVPVDIGNDGIVDFVGFVQTPLRSWPQVEQRYTYGYISRATAPLGREIKNESLLGTNGPDKIWGFDGDDEIFGRNGDDLINGGSGLDVASYSGRENEYLISKLGDGWKIISLSGNDGTDQLINIERIKFSNSCIAVDSDGNAGKSYRIYKAAFNRTPDTGGLGYWIAQMDKGMDVVAVAARFIDSSEFRSIYGQNPTNAEFLTKVYSNVLARTPDAAGLDWWVNEMKTNPTKTWQKVLADFSESTENQANVASLIANGMEYVPWTG